MIALILITASINFFTSKNINEQYDHLLEITVEEVNLLDDIMIEQGQIAANIRSYMLVHDESYIDGVVEREQKVDRFIDELRASIRQSEFLTLLDEIDFHQETHATIANDILVAAEQEDTVAMQRIANDMTPHNNAIFQLSTELKEKLEANIEREKDELTATIEKSNTIVFGILMLALVISITITYVMNRNLSRPIRSTTFALKEMANGNLSISHVKATTKDEIAQMATALNTMLDTWKQVIQKINGTSNELAAQSEELSASAEESLASSEMVAQSAEQNMKNSEIQANYITQSIHSVQEVGLGIDQIADSNEEMLHSASEMGHYVTEGVDVVRDVSSHMNAIDEMIQQSATIMEEMAQKSIEIQEVSTLISGISDQTNLLALNASIEAARAGEHGKGFAVVAEEVRQLAEESQTSAAKIEMMITEVKQASERAVGAIIAGQEKVKSGLKSSERSLGMFSNIESSVGDVNGKIETISAAIEEIQAMATEVTTNTESLHSLAEDAANSAQETGAATEEQLAAMQEITSSSEALSVLAEDLRDEVAQFKI